MRTAKAIAGIGLLIACAPIMTGAKKAPPAATPIGKPQDCVRLVEIDTTRVRDNSTIDFVMKGGKVYRNVLPYSCPGLGFNERFSYKTSLDRLCSVDVITVLDSPSIPGASCGLGKFQPVQLHRH